MQRHISDLEAEYFDFMYKTVCGNNLFTTGPTYKSLLHFLHSKEFIPTISLDNNRRLDGIDFRYQFGIDCGYSKEYIDTHMMSDSCSVLEMMIALAFRCEDQIMTNTKYGDRTSQWFWGMISSLGLGHVDDKNFNEEYCEQVIFNFINHNYEFNGNGGLFTLSHPHSDMRKAQIWYQLMWYLDENFSE